ncbi:MAG: hypothetical protein K2W95_28080 [Candidatus Obscuribacterales bacterium]|nr:hypothetical protein [Candidatus Obscuribacterales bacterium]
MNSTTLERKPSNTEFQSSQAKKQKRPLLRTLAAIFVWQLIAILFVEFTLFCAGLGEEEIFKLDPELGSIHMPNKRITWRSEGYSVSWFNEVGMRESNITVAKPAGTLRVALLGDSLTEALQVPLDSSFGRVMERKLSAALHQPVQVLNFGVSGYSTAQEYMMLKRRVLSYKPDVVLACYNSRDSFENWSAPDQVITNVRPYALHLPGGKLTIDTSPVKNWMKTPRAKFLNQFEWLRQNSRLWGLFAVLELDWSMHSDTYRYMLLFVTRPGKAIRELSSRVKSDIAKIFPPKQELPASTTVVDTKSAQAAPSAESAAALKSDNKTALNASPKKPNAAASTAPAPAKKQDGRPGYQQFIMRSLGSLLTEMQKETVATGGRFAVVAMPVRSALCPAEGIDTAFNDFTYKDEIVMLNEICADKQISIIDLEKPAESFGPQYRKDMFYSVHLTKQGHDYVGERLASFVEPLLSRPQK